MGRHFGIKQNSHKNQINTSGSQLSLPSGNFLFLEMERSCTNSTKSQAGKPLHPTCLQPDPGVLGHFNSKIFTGEHRAWGPSEVTINKKKGFNSPPTSPPSSQFSNTGLVIPSHTLFPPTTANNESRMLKCDKVR